MRTFIIFTFLVTMSCHKLHAQNLVPNPSFEDTLSCPNALGQVNKLEDWFSARPSSDFFNVCSTNISCSVPKNFWGYQFPSSGKGYVGLTAVSSYSTNTREYLGVHLNAPLIPGNIYYINLKVVLGLESSIAMCACNNLGVYFSNAYYDGINDTLKLNNQASAFTSQIIIDTLNWTNINFIFQADSAYNYLYIGNFYNDSLTNVSPNFVGCTAYYYFEDICVSVDSNFCAQAFTNLVEEKNCNSSMVIFPNPSSDLLFLKLGNIKNFDKTHIKVVHQDLKFIQHFDKIVDSNIELNIEFWPNGIYFIQLINDNHIEAKQIFIKTK